LRFGLVWALIGRLIVENPPSTYDWSVAFPKNGWFG
jgi:hypothetical protein